MQLKKHDVTVILAKKALNWKMLDNEISKCCFLLSLHVVKFL